MPLNIVFVLVGTTHAGNIGGAARAIKNMGFSTLRLVDTCSPNKKDAITRASGADDILENAQRFDHLADAIGDCQVVVGASARPRFLSVPLRGCREITESVAAINPDSNQTVAFVFGRERSGLTNDELDQCTEQLQIPCNPDFSSLNLSAAVQVVAYECGMALRSTSTSPTNQTTPVASESMQHFFKHLERVMVNTGFLDPANPRLRMRRIQGYFERNRPTDTEMSILRGILTATEDPHPPKEKLS